MSLHLFDVNALLTGPALTSEAVDDISPVFVYGCVTPINKNANRSTGRGGYKNRLATRRDLAEPGAIGRAAVETVPSLLCVGSSSPQEPFLC